MVPFDCLTPEALQAHAASSLDIADARLRAAPAGLGEKPALPPPAGAKAVYGSNYPNHLETANFTIQWEGHAGSVAAAEAAGEALEAAWTWFVDEQGWAPPVSSDDYYLWVLLVDDLSGTGLTSEYTTPEYPQGYPVIFLNSAWASDDGFWRSLAIHEFHHTLQYRLRDYTGAEGEAWYWEASAMWADRLVEPDSDAVDYTVDWYADQSSLRFDSEEGSHQYGIFVLNGWLETLGPGPGTMKAVWEASESATETPWDILLAGTTGLSAAEIWGGFSGAFGNDAYDRGAHWSDPHTAEIADGLPGEASKLGTRYYVATEATNVGVSVVEGEVVLAGLDGPAEALAVEPGDVIAVTATSEDGATWALRTSVEIEDTAAPEDTDAGEDTAPGDDTDPGVVSDGDSGGGKIASSTGCGCAQAPGARASIWVFAGGLVWLWTRRRPAG